MNEVIDIRQHRAEIQADGSMHIVLLAKRWARARDARLVASKAKKAAEGRGVLYALRSGTDQALTAARRE